MSKSSETRTDLLLRARRRASQTKQDQALAAVERLRSTGQAVTFTATARAAGVSTWFAYNNAVVAAAIRQAQTDQVENGLQSHPQPQERVTAASLRAELSNSRQEVKELRHENARLHAALATRLGATLERLDLDEVLARMRDAEVRNVRLEADLEADAIAKAELTSQLAVAQDELTAARDALRRSMHVVSVPSS